MAWSHARDSRCLSAVRTCWRRQAVAAQAVQRGAEIIAFAIKSDGPAGPSCKLLRSESGHREG